MDVSNVREICILFASTALVSAKLQDSTVINTVNQSINKQEHTTNGQGNEETQGNTAVNMLTQELDNLAISKIVEAGEKAKNEEENIKERRMEDQVIEEDDEVEKEVGDVAAEDEEVRDEEVGDVAAEDEEVRDEEMGDVAAEDEEVRDEDEVEEMGEEETGKGMENEADMQDNEEVEEKLGEDIVDGAYQEVEEKLALIENYWEEQSKEDGGVGNVQGEEKDEGDGRVQSSEEFKELNEVGDE